MSSRCLEITSGLLALALLAGCEREARRFSEPSGDALTAGVAQSELRAGGASVIAAAAVSPTMRPYEDNAFAVSEGQRLFEWFNCSGCHGHGGGAIGPALMDDVWIYGAAPEQIFATIVQGRPNGMPAFGGRVPQQQVWQLVAYVRSLAGGLRKDVEPGRPDAMHMRPAPAQTRPPAEGPDP